ncbi:MAG: DUF58 domain-containing protein, partial [Thiothrix sp.]|nr:DUF58 domain-containing protein [Thiothrix sp.]
YQPGDDIRTIDWRVTARSGRVHTKVFQEERERPVLIWLDLRPAMFFATRGRFKSVLASEVAGLLVWKTIAQGDRAGGVVQSGSDYAEFKPARSRGAALNFMRHMAQFTRREGREAGQGREQVALEDSWRRLCRVAEQGAEVFVISDFREAEAQSLQQLARINRQAPVTLIAIRDPFEQVIPEQGSYRFTDGAGHSLWVNLGLKSWRERYLARGRQTSASLQEFARKHRMTLVQLSTADEELIRLQKLAGGVR